MKNLFIIALLLAGKITLAQQSVIIRGKVQNLEGHKLAIIYYNPQKKVRDTISLNNGKFEAKIDIDATQEIAVYPYNFYKYAVPTAKPNQFFLQPVLKIFVAPGDVITVDGDAKNLWEAKVSGGKYNKEYALFRSLVMPLETREYSLLAKQYSKENLQDTVAFNKLRVERWEVKDKIKSLIKDFYEKNTTSIYALYKFSENLKSMKPEEIKQLFAIYSLELQQSDIGEKVYGYLQKVKSVNIGAKMIDFTGTTLKGNVFDSKSLKGKYALLDFWGSWCGPCRKSNPHLKELYNKYSKQGFEIVGIAQENRSLEKGKVSWKKAVEEDGLPWIQLLNEELKAAGGDLVKAYNVHSFPTKILINKDGIILWKGVGSEKGLDELLTEIFPR
ncbi:TlpA disulfide reductase family protein [Pedobacter sp.]|jgi:thiol-disulfide isomerase/thioredoxin|uniref:TlpA disulfide reductase family protein n=1 Tax=Pedobacter sp. TaxID=1411316 RepID=UPI002C8D08AD|nr:TlpA disulfide reductase family protein [Pedobacter sp.]HWW41558.1 TlpA disulfide reductase family protein [Pedobacter sp.]